MKILTWALQIILALVFYAASISKFITPYEEMIVDPNLLWTNDFSIITIWMIGVLEFLGATGVTLPMILKRNLSLVPISAVGLSMTMIGAIATHVGRNEPFILPVILLIIAVSVVYLRRELFFE